MRRAHALLIAVGMLSASALVCAQPAQQQTQPRAPVRADLPANVRVFDVPPGSRPHDVAPGPTGLVW